MKWVLEENSTRKGEGRETERKDVGETEGNGEVGRWDLEKGDHPRARGSRAEQSRRCTERGTTVILKGTAPRGRAQRQVAQAVTWGPCFPDHRWQV